jgi:hypothetical protein
MVILAKPFSPSQFLPMRQNSAIIINHILGHYNGNKVKKSKVIPVTDVKDPTLSRLTARYWLLVAVLTVQFVPHRKHTPSS